MINLLNISSLANLGSKRGAVNSSPVINTWSYFATAGAEPQTWQAMETAGGYERTWDDLTL